MERASNTDVARTRDAPVGKIPIKKVRDSEAGGMPSVKNEEYFHGFMPKDQTDGLLRNVGDFLVRQAVKAECKKTSVEQFLISIRVLPSHSDNDGSKLPSEGEESQTGAGQTNRTEEQKLEDAKRAEKELRHLPIKYSRRSRVYYIKDYGFKLVSGLIDYHRRNGLPIDDENTLLKKPIKRAEWQLNHEQVMKTKKLGDGAFGDVFLGSLRVGLISRIDVAIKTVNGTITADENAKLFQEAMLMKHLIHPNVVQLVGVASNEEPVMIIMEFCPGGSLLDVVKKKTPSLHLRVKWCHGAAKGLEYLAKNNIIHRDIAARNCLVGKHNEAKISDFGLSIVGLAKKEKTLKKVPFPYLSLETLTKGVYTKMTDVWSFGVMMWEVFHDGKAPFEGDCQRDIKKFLVAGNRLGNSSPHYPKYLWEATLSCWSANPDDRPPFTELTAIIASGMNDYSDGSVWGTLKDMFSRKKAVDLELASAKGTDPEMGKKTDTDTGAKTGTEPAEVQKGPDQV